MSLEALALGIRAGDALSELGSEGGAVTECQGLWASKDTQLRTNIKEGRVHFGRKHINNAGRNGK